MQCRGVVLAATIDRQASFQQQADRGGVIVSRGVRKLAQFGRSEQMHDLSILREQCVNGGFIVDPRMVDKPYFLRAAVHEELEKFVMTASLGDLMRRDMPAESPLIDRPSGFS